MKQDSRKYIASIVFFRKFIKVFFSIFFNVYILKIVNNDLNFIIQYSVVGLVAELIITYVVLKFINSKNAKTIYKFSFFLLILLIGLLLIFKENIVYYILPFKILASLETVCYSLPYELAVIGTNTKQSISSFIANINILENVAVILTPLFSGFIIESFSYNMLFVLLIIEAIIVVSIAIKIKDFTVSNKKLELKKFWKKVKDKKFMKDIYKCMFYRRISTQGAVKELLPIILFLRLGTEFDLGVYNSIFAVLSIFALQILKIVNKKNNSKTFYPYLAMIIFITSIETVFHTSFYMLLIYYLVINTLGTIIENESCSAVYAVIKTEELLLYKKEHIVIYNIYMYIGQLISYALLYVLYNYFYNVNILSVVVCILMFFLIISTIYLRKVQKAIQKESLV